MHKVFIWYHHDKDQCYKDFLVDAARQHRNVMDGSVNTGDIEDSLPDEQIHALVQKSNWMLLRPSQPAG